MLKNVCLVLFTILLHIQVFGQNRKLDTKEKENLDRFDDYLANIVAKYNYSESHLKFTTYKKWLKNDTVDKTKRNPILAIKYTIENNEILKELGFKQAAIDKMRKEMVEIRLNSTNTQNEQRRIFQVISKSKFYFADGVYQGFDELGVYNKDSTIASFKLKVGYIKNYNTIHYLHVCLKNWIELNSLYSTNQNYTLLEDKMRVLNNRLTEITSENYYKFGYTEISNEKIKDIELNTSNDMFTDFNIFDYNKDMGYTGGLSMSFATDYFKMRLLPYVNGDNILSYQTIDIGFKVFTPYIRDTIQDLKLLSYQYDRPFASTLYLGRTKHRLHRNGNLRHTGKFHLIIIGSQTGKYFQELLHKDFTVESIKPVGWNNQISNGGRLGYSLYHKFDFLLSSENSSIIKPWKTTKTKFINPFLSFEGQLSHERTYVGSSLNISSSNFSNSSGKLNDFKLKKLQKYRFDYLVGAKMSYVVHNSLLGDFGITQRYDDDKFDDEFLSNYFLTSNLIENWVWDFYSQVSFKYRKTTFFYTLNFQKKEFKERTYEEGIDDNYKRILENRFNYNFYGYGTIGIVFNL